MTLNTGRWCAKCKCSKVNLWSRPSRQHNCWTTFSGQPLVGVFVPSFWLLIPPGWLTIYASGHLHGDISIGNILRIDPPAPAKSVADCLEELTNQQINRLMPSQVDTSLQHTENPGSSAQTTEQSSPPISVEELRSQQNRLLSILSELELGQYSAFVTDGDMAIELDNYFSKTKHQNELSVSSVLDLHGYPAKTTVTRVHQNSCLMIFVMLSE